MTASIDPQRYLVVAHRTADSAELFERLRDLSEGTQGAQFVLLVPATPPTYLEELSEGRVRPAMAIAAERARRIRERMLALELNVVAARVGNWDPVQAVAEELRHESYSAIVLSTLPPGVSRWLRMDVPARLARRFPKVRIDHVIAGTAAPVGARPVPSAEAVGAHAGRSLELGADEVALVDRVLSSYLGELRMEVRATDNRRVRSDLHQEEALIRGVIEQLKSPPKGVS